MQRGAQKRENRVPDDGGYPGLKISMTKAEMTQFSLGTRSLQDLLDELTPLVRQYARAGFRRPAEVARLLNHANHKTASGERWTPRLAGHLLSLIFTGSATRQVKPVSVEKKYARGQKATRSTKSGTAVEPYKPRRPKMPTSDAIILFNENKRRQTIPDVAIKTKSGRTINLNVVVSTPIKTQE